ncbi:MAG: hypothetical protein A3C43_06745 [Candidatus Schekmanbacteria bacterium RIFCSPHIGHO2_02_FULL_38_11]|uniref:Uncharacterized protein n=1 Tax=Candidatus Schekmanbacteria bacterium RIFCSPLOWO2_12_FULL_38_15 TaxID=1817883 RepID=A0A1F7SMD4_9BACT|nr:MAG: hypothetical protein A2043_08335 [Candidatus Schekmanbacteria bacterium GWA2_38_9]OGL48458.1 MAG: hypothetical protein A3H37_07490 [Candidatus Schekmanbacteria bacterium RIFCSPLOWO2_02_FULL_38_14]OGL50186.1 MAG: hypothetical protein A3C43_06745 [Candidatus Schekmanbacteria bacterium RIFCSPHIGHO2_02_FULL_38_11]OGL54941.1 MAG: hypothetical protein A3G31_02350 [Candidatus Schekmanbacteria bacterium RIFCSPLOWO2_12_FULL_38_15]
MNILLINPEENVPQQTEIYPSGALVLMGTMLSQEGHNVCITHLTNERINIKGLKAKILEFSPDIVGITMNTYQTKSARIISNLAKEVSKDIRVVAGGPHSSALKIELFKNFPNIDVVVFSEGEHTFSEIVDGKNLEGIKGICFKGIVNDPRPFVADLDYLPLPDLDLVKDLYRFTGGPPVIQKPCMYIMASRGCPFQCTFCNVSVFGKHTRFRKPEKVIEEIKWLYNRYHMREIYIQDDTFNLNKEWAEELLNLIIENKLNEEIVYKAAFRANEKLLNSHLLKLARRANIQVILFGGESGNQTMLNKMKKGITIEELERAFRLTHEAGIKTVGSFMIGNIGENYSTVIDTLKFIKKVNSFYVGFSMASPFPGTELQKILIQKGHLMEKDYERFDAHNCTIRTDALSKMEIKLLWLLGNIYIVILELLKPDSTTLVLKEILKKIQELIAPYRLFKKRKKY